ITRFPFSSAYYRYHTAVRCFLLLRPCDSIRCGIKSGAILAFRNSSPRPRRSNIWEAQSLPRAKALPLPARRGGSANRMGRMRCSRVGFQRLADTYFFVQKVTKITKDFSLGRTESFFPLPARESSRSYLLFRD